MIVLGMGRVGCPLVVRARVSLSKSFSRQRT